MKREMVVMCLVVVIVSLALFVGTADARNLMSWDKKIGDAEKRFVVKWGGTIVLDKETGLVWEQSPDTTTRTWHDALIHCFIKKVGGRKGWRAPTIEELATLVDDTQGPPTLPSGHPFDTSAVQSSRYWSSTTTTFDAGGAWYVNFGDGSPAGNVTTLFKASTELVWCVRGGQGHDAY